MNRLAPFVIVVDDKSSMWGNVVRVFGPYPSRDAADLDLERVRGMYPQRAFIEITSMQPAEIAPAAPLKSKTKAAPLGWY